MEVKEPSCEGEETREFKFSSPISMGFLETELTFLRKE